MEDAPETELQSAAPSALVKRWIALAAALLVVTGLAAIPASRPSHNATQVANRAAGTTSTTQGDLSTGETLSLGDSTTTTAPPTPMTVAPTTTLAPPATTTTTLPSPDTTDTTEPPVTADKLITEYLIPTPNAWAYEIAAGGDGALWFTENAAGKIGRITTDGTITESAPDANKLGNPMGITRGPDGRMWFSEGNANNVGAVANLADITQYPIATRAGSWGLVAGPDAAVWTTGCCGGASSLLVRITTTGAVTSFPIPSEAPYGIASGPDGSLWVNRLNAVERVTTGGAATDFAFPPLPGGDVMYTMAMTRGPDNAMWFGWSDSASSNVGLARVTTSGAISRFELPFGSGQILRMVAGPDGNIWFTAGDAVGRMTPSGQSTFYKVSRPAGIAAGSDGNIWFTELDTNLIGRLNVAVADLH